MTHRGTRLAAIFVIWASMQTPAFAYLDGATGSILLQAAIGLIASWMVYFRLFKAKARLFLARLTGKAPTQNEGE